MLCRSSVVLHQQIAVLHQQIVVLHQQILEHFVLLSEEKSHVATQLQGSHRSSMLYTDTAIVISQSDSEARYH